MPDACILNDRVVIDRDVARAAGQRQKVAVATPVLAVDIGEEIVTDDDPRVC